MPVTVYKESDYAERITVERPLRVTTLISSFTCRRERDFHFSGEAHDFWELVYVCDGTVGIMADDRVLECGAGTVVFHKPGEFHRVWSAGGTTPQYTVIAFGAEGEAMARLAHAVIPLSGEADRLMLALTEQIAVCRPVGLQMPAALQEEPLTLARYIALLELFLLTCMELGHAPTPLSHPDAELFSQAVATMRRHMTAPLSLPQLARELHVSVSHLKRIFGRYAQTGVHAYGLQLRIRRAKELLQAGESVCAVAAAVGFANQNYFSAAFKRETGVSPGRWPSKQT